MNALTPWMIVLSCLALAPQIQTAQPQPGQHQSTEAQWSWRSDLAVAEQEAARSERPLLVVFR